MSRAGAAPTSRTTSPGNVPSRSRFRPGKAPTRFGLVGEKVELSENTRLQAAVNDPALQGPGMRAIVVVHDGRIVAEAYGQGFGAATTLQGWSMTKSVTAALVGMAIGDGKLSLDQKHLFPQWAGDARSEISIADLMAMTGGLKWNEDEGRITDPGRMEYLVRDTAAFARDLPLDTPPGTRFNYSSAQSVLLTRLVAGRGWRGSSVLSARAAVQSARHDQRRARGRRGRHVSRRRFSLRHRA